MDFILHIIGICGDTHTHFDLIDFFLLGGSSIPIITYFKYKLKILNNNKK